MADAGAGAGAGVATAAVGASAAPPMQDLPGAVRRAAEALRNASGVTDRVRATQEFQSLARMLRAAQPPLLLPHRSGSAARRFGYFIDPRNAAALSAIERAHADAGDRVSLFVIGRGRAVPRGSGAVDLTGVAEPQALRIVAQAELDVLVDLDGSALSEAPLLVAMQPARAIVEPWFAPAATAGAGLRDAIAVAKDDIAGVLAVARTAVADVPALPDGVGPSDLAVLLEQAIRQHRSGIVDAARAGYQAVLERYPQHPVASYLLGQLRAAQGASDDAIAAFRQAAAVAPEFRDAHYALAQRLAERDSWCDALPAYARSVELTPQFAAGWSGLGLATLRSGRPSDAVAHLDRAVAIEPASPQWRFNLGTALQRSGRLAEARDAYRRALELDPRHRDARFNLGAVLQELGDYRAAIDAYRRILADDATFAPAYPELGACLQLTGQVEAWLENFLHYAKHCPPSLPMAVYGLEAAMAAGDVEGHLRWREGIVSGDLVAADADEFVNAWEQLLFLLLHVDVDRATLRDCYERYDAAARALYGPPLPVSPRKPGPVRVGYVSGDLRDHVMGRMIHEWVTRHDRSRFAVTLYSLSSAEDAWTDRFRALDVSWVDLALLPLDEACERIAKDDIDILVDCAGHTRNGRPGIFARKPARIQATHIATPGPLGLETVDYKLTDALSEADDAQRYLIERLMPVPGGVFPWHRYGPIDQSFPRPRNSPDQGYGGTPVVAATGALAERRTDAFVCGAFVSLMKLSPRCLALWRRLLDAIPGATLAFSPPSEEWRASYLRWLAANGIPSGRVTFMPYEAGEEGRLSRYAALDVTLDPLPCGNVNGTMESLAMGVPVITLAGVRHGERLGNALLSRFGLTDTIAMSDDEYVAIATMLASEPDAAQRMRERIRQLAISSAVWNSEAQVRNVEAVYEQMLGDQVVSRG